MYLASLHCTILSAELIRNAHDFFLIFFIEPTVSSLKAPECCEVEAEISMLPFLWLP